MRLRNTMESEWRSKYEQASEELRQLKQQMREGRENTFTENQRLKVTPLARPGSGGYPSVEPVPQGVQPTQGLYSNLPLICQITLFHGLGLFFISNMEAHAQFLGTMRKSCVKHFQCQN